MSKQSGLDYIQEKIEESRGEAGELEERAKERRRGENKLRELRDKFEKLEVRIGKDFDTDEVIDFMSEKKLKDPLVAYRKLRHKPEDWEPVPMRGINLPDRLYNELWKDVPEEGLPPGAPRTPGELPESSHKVTWGFKVKKPKKEE